MGVKWAIAAIVAVSALGSGASLATAQSVGIGAPTSAAGGVSPAPLVPSSPGLPSAVGPLDSSDGSAAGSSGGGSTSSSIHDLTPGTGKFETPKNAPCIGTTGFGSEAVQPGHKC